MHINFSLSIAGLVVGLLVGLTGMGGGALLTPVLVLFFRVLPLAAISSDLLTSLVMKPVGAAVHLRRRTVKWRLVAWLTTGSVPAAFGGAVCIGEIGHSHSVQHAVKLAIGIALLVSVTATVARQLLDRRARRSSPDPPSGPDIVVRPVLTVMIGVAGGFAVGMTSVGAGSLIIALLLIVYPRLRPAQLVGTDIVQAIPLVGAATVGHLIFGDVQVAVTVSLLIGALPGTYIGARLSAQGPGVVIRPVIGAVLVASALALFSVPTPAVIAAAVAAAVLLVSLQSSITRRPPAPSGSGAAPLPAAPAPPARRRRDTRLWRALRGSGVIRAYRGIQDEKLPQAGQQALPAAGQPGTGTAKGEDDRARAR